MNNLQIALLKGNPQYYIHHPKGNTKTYIREMVSPHRKDFTRCSEREREGRDRLVVYILTHKPITDTHINEDMYMCTRVCMHNVLAL